jgi:hypothetical protein
VAESVNYVTNERGEKVGVLLDLETYQQLLVPLGSDPDVFVDLSMGELQALAESTLAPTAQTQLDNLLAQHAENQLSADEIATLDRLLAQVDQLNILKTRARYTLRHLKEVSRVM